MQSQKFISNSLHTLVTKVFVIFLKMGVSVVTARTLGASGRGGFYSITQGSGTIASIGTMSVGEGIIFGITKKEVAREHILGNVLLMMFLFTCTLWGAIYLVEPWLTSNLLKDIPEESMGYVYLLIPLMMIEYFSTSSFKGLEKYKELNRLTIVNRTIILAVLCIALLGIEASLLVALKSYSIALAIVALIFIISLWRFSGYKLRCSFKDIKNNLSFGAKVHVGTLLTEVEYRSDIFILLFLLSPAAVGIYSIGVTVAQIMWYVSNSINTVLFPTLVGKKSDRDRTSFSVLVGKYTFAVNVLVLIGLAIIADWLILLLFGDAFSEAYYVFLLLIPGMLADSIGRTLSAWAKGRGKPVIVSVFASISLVINIFLNFALIPEYGIYGAAIASSVSYSFRTLLFMVYFKMESGVSPVEFFKFKKEELEKIINILSKMLNKNRTRSN